MNEQQGDEIHLNATEEAALERAWSRIEKEGLPPRKPLPGRTDALAAKKARKDAREKNPPR